MVRPSSRASVGDPADETKGRPGSRRPDARTIACAADIAGHSGGTLLVDLPPKPAVQDDPASAGALQVRHSLESRAACSLMPEPRVMAHPKPYRAQLLDLPRVVVCNTSSATRLAKEGASRTVRSVGISQIQVVDVSFGERLRDADLVQFHGSQK
jgi:hypothetical protein